MGKQPDKEKLYVKLAKILVSSKGEKYDLNQKFSVLLNDYINRLIKIRFDILATTTAQIKFLTSDFYEYICKLEGVPPDKEYLKSFNYALLTKEEVNLIVSKIKNQYLVIKAKLSEFAKKSK